MNFNVEEFKKNMDQIFDKLYDTPNHVIKAQIREGKQKEKELLKIKKEEEKLQKKLQKEEEKIQKQLLKKSKI
jgi:hypothetical protein